MGIGESWRFGFWQLLSLARPGLIVRVCAERGRAGSCEGGYGGNERAGKENHGFAGAFCSKMDLWKGSCLGSEMRRPPLWAGGP